MRQRTDLSMSLCDKNWAKAESGGSESGERGVGLGSIEAVTAYSSHSLRLRDRTVALYIKYQHHHTRSNLFVDKFGVALGLRIV